MAARQEISSTMATAVASLAKAQLAVLRELNSAENPESSSELRHLSDAELRRELLKHVSEEDLARNLAERNKNPS